MARNLAAIVQLKNKTKRQDRCQNIEYKYWLSLLHFPLQLAVYVPLLPIAEGDWGIRLPHNDFYGKWASPTQMDEGF